jgi:hypothetical protein
MLTLTLIGIILTLIMLADLGRMVRRMLEV